MMDPSKIREKIGRFRILVIGRANAGKTTILQRVCNTQETPEIYNSAGEKIDATVLMASTERGEHDIENEMVFQNNPGFIFHDSRGFEAGGEFEFDKVKAFIASRSKEIKLKDQLHAIWYCIPMDEASRSFTEAEIEIFSQCDTGSIPVIVLFTKFDALYVLAYSELKSKGASTEKAEELAPKHAEKSRPRGGRMADAQQQHLTTLTLTTWTASSMILQHAHLLHPIVHVDIPLVSIHPHHPNSSGVPRPNYLTGSNSQYHCNAHPKAHIMLTRTMTTG